MKLLFPAVLLCFFIAACKKDQYDTKPQIEVKSVNTRVVPVNGDLVVTLEFRDKQGDVSDSIYILKERLNKAPVQDSILRSFIGKEIPDFPSAPRGEFQLNLTYENYLKSAATPNKNPITGEVEPDSLNFRFVVKDKAGNKSDTALLENIIILRK